MPTKKKTDPLYAIKYDPHRSPSWRYERAVRLHDNRQPLHPTFDDKYIARYRDFLAASDDMSRKNTDEHIIRCRLASDFTHVWNASRLFYDGRDSRTRWGLEAMILARMSRDEMADRSQCEPDTISWYEKLFFNVTDRLEAKEYIGSIVLKNAFMSGLPNRTGELTAKYFGYFGGELVLKLILDAIDESSPMPTEPHELSRYIDYQFRLRLRTSALIGVTFLEPNNFNFGALLESYTAILSLQHRETSNAGDDNIINQGLEIFSSQNRLPVGDAASKMQSRPGRLIAGGAIEPRVDEIPSVLMDRLGNDISRFTDDWIPPEPSVKDEE